MMLPSRQTTRTDSDNVITIQNPTLGNLANFSDIGSPTTAGSGETATCPLMLKATFEPRDSPAQCKKKYANQHWPTEHLNKQPSVIFKVTTIITPTVAIDNQTSWIAFPECPCGPGYRTDNPNMPPVQLLHGSRTSPADATNAGGRKAGPVRSANIDGGGGPQLLQHVVELALNLVQAAQDQGEVVVGGQELTEE